MSEPRSEARYVTSADGTRIAYEAYGSGPTVVIVNTAFDTRWRERELAVLLSGEATAVVYDRRGRGDSGDTQPYAPVREIEDLRAVIEAVGAPAFVYGDMFGGALALRAVAAGLPIARLAVFEPPYVVDGSRPPYPGDFVESLRALIRAGHRREVVDAYYRHCFLMHETVIENGRDLPFRRPFAAIAHTLVYDYEILGDAIDGRPLPAAIGESVTIPVLIFEHADSQPYLRSAAAALEALLSNARKRTFTGDDHLVSASKLARALTTFFGPKVPRKRPSPIRAG